jgi:GAF domain-containing protein/CheY-like chemotaxis protein
VWFPLVALPLGALAGAGVAVALRQLAHSRELAVAQTVGAVTTLVAETDTALRREAALLARDPALVDGVAKSDWATLARFASPRILAITREGFADLVVVRDASGVPLVQVPAVPPPVIPRFTALTDPVVTLRLVNDQPLFLAAAPIWISPARDDAARVQVGTVVIGRRFERLARLLDNLSTRPGIVLVAGDRALASTRPGVPVSGWSGAVSSRRLAIGGDLFALRPLPSGTADSPDGSLWAVVPDLEQSAVQRRLWIWLGGLLAVGAATLALVTWVLVRAGAPPAPPGDGDGKASGPMPEPLHGPGRELEALNARLLADAKQSAAEYQALYEVAGLVGSTLDVDRLLDLIVDRCRALTGVASAGIFRLDTDTGLLAYERGIGLSPEFVNALRVRVGEGTTGKAVGDRKPVWSADLLNDSTITLGPETRDLVAREGYRAALSVPILRSGEPQGVLSAYWWEPHVPSPSEVAVMSALAAQAGVALENARLYGLAVSHANRLRTLARLSQLVSSSLDAGAVLEAIARAAAEIMGASFVAVYVADESSRTLELRAASDEAMGAALPVKRRRFGEGLVGMVAERRQTLQVGDVLNEERAMALDWARTYGLRSFFGVPIIFQDSLLGVLTLNDPVPLRLDADDEKLLESFVSQAAVAIRNTRLYAATAKHLEETRALLEVAEILNSTLDPRRLLKQVAIKVAQVCRVDRCTIERWDGDRVIPLMSQFADGRADDRLWDAFMNLPSYPPRDVPAHAKAIETRRPVVIPDTSTTDLIPREWTDTFGHKSYMVVPLIRQDAVIGVMNLDHVERVTPFQPWQVDLAMAVAGQLALSIENTRLYSEVQERLRETEQLLSVSRALASTLDLETLPRQFLRQVIGALGADTAGLWLLGEDGETMEPMVGYHVPPDRLDALRQLRLSIVHDPFYAEAATTRRPVVSTDVMGDARIPRALREAAPHRTQVFVPVIAQDRIVGGFGVTWWETARGLSEGELRLMETIGGQAGVALENARLFRDNQRRLEELSVLHQLSRVMTGQLDQAELLDTIEQQLARLLDVRHIVILLHDESNDDLEVVLRVKDGARQEAEPRRYPRDAAGLSGIVLDTARPIRTEDYPGECARRGVEPVPESVDLPHWLGVPMVTGSRTLGVLALRSRDRAFAESDQRLLASIADLAALALRSARLYEERARAHRELAAAQDQLVRTEKLRAMGEMASGVAHDFNNVLAAILGRAQLLAGRVEDPKLRQWIEVIERSALDGARTVRRLQDFTRIRRDHPVVPVDLNQVVQETLEATEPSWRQESQSRGVPVEVATSLTAPLPEISGDPAELREALTNLILNALDAMPGGGKLTLATSVAGGHVELAVTDTGAGIPAGIRHKIFDPFFTTKGPKGTGLGLSMTYGILARHGARIAVESEEGLGATFRLIFPASAADKAPARPIDRPRAAGSSLRCLVVDDEEAVAAVLGDMLTAAGHRVEVVDSGQEAIARFGAESFDLVLTDLAMPGMTGWEVARAVKAMAPTTCVVLVSGFGVELSPEDLRAHGVDLVLAKPLRLQDIDHAVALAGSPRE